MIAIPMPDRKTGFQTRNCGFETVAPSSRGVQTINPMQTSGMLSSYLFTQQVLLWIVAHVARRGLIAFLWCRIIFRELAIAWIDVELWFLDQVEAAYYFIHNREKPSGE